MKKLPKIALVGRPNVGKSALFNRICGQRIAIVDEAEGITRDRLYTQSECFGKHFELIDTGGIDAHSKKDFNDEVKQQAEIAIEEADSIIMVVDSQIGITTLDKELSSILLKTNKPLCLAINKIDHLNHDDALHDFYSLGIENIVGVSATQGRHIAEMLEKALAPIPQIQPEDLPTHPRIAIVGQANVGKSTLMNALLNEKRCIVSPIPGTTRDSIDVDIQAHGATYTLIDTAGIRRKRAEHEVVDKFAAIRTQRAIERCDICLFLVDAQHGMTTQAKQIANMLQKAGKGCIILLNKWDLVENCRMEHCLKSLEIEAPFLKYCPKIFISALTGRNLEKIFPKVADVNQNFKTRITTGELNSFIEKAIQKYPPPMITGKRLRIYYMTQVDISPPTFVYFVNFQDRMARSYERYLYNHFRKHYQFEGVPLVFHLKGKGN